MTADVNKWYDVAHSKHQSSVLLTFCMSNTKKTVNWNYICIGIDKQNFRRKILTIFLPIIFSICFGCSKDRLIERVLLSTHNICFGCEIRKLFFCYALITKGLICDKHIMTQGFGLALNINPRPLSTMKLKLPGW